MKYLGTAGKRGDKVAIIEAAIRRELRELGFSESHIQEQMDRVREGKVIIVSRDGTRVIS